MYLVLVLVFSFSCSVFVFSLHVVTVSGYRDLVRTRVRLREGEGGLARRGRCSRAVVTAARPAMMAHVASSSRLRCTAVSVSVHWKARLMAAPIREPRR